MLLQPSQKLEERLIAVLARTPSLTAQQLLNRVARAGRQFSLPAIYQELRKLAAGGIAVKLGDRYSLRLAWVLEMMEFADGMYDTYVQGAPMRDFLPGEGEKLRYQFRSFSSLAGFWTQLDLALCQHAPDRVLFEWVPHAWFHLANPRTEQQFLNGMKLAGNKYYLIIGDDTFLDRSYIEELSGLEKCEVSFAESPFHAEQTTYYSLIADYIFTVKPDKKKCAGLDELFSRISSDGDIDHFQLKDIFSAPTTIRTVLERNKHKAAKMRRKFADYFGLSS